MISRQVFGRSQFLCSRVIFGSWALNKATQKKADSTLNLLHEYGVNCIDTAPMYGNAEKLIGTWLAKHRDDYFIATKTRSRSRQGALNSLEKSLENLQVEYIDLWQMHGLTNRVGWEKAMGPDGALEAFIEARDNGLVRFLGVTGHGNKAPIMHKLSLEQFEFDSVLLPYNYILMQDPRYSTDFNELVENCKNREVTVLTIKSIARRSWGDRPKTYNTYFYEPLESQDAIDKNVHWSLSLPNSFLISAGDIHLLPKVLNAANRYELKPTEEEMKDIVRDYEIQSIFIRSRKRVHGKGPQTWGGKMSNIIEKLIREGFFDFPNERSIDQVLEALKANGIPSDDKRKNVTNALDRRVKKGVLIKKETSNGWLYLKNN